MTMVVSWDLGIHVYQDDVIRRSRFAVHNREISPALETILLDSRGRNGVQVVIVSELEPSRSQIKPEHTLPTAASVPLPAPGVCFPRSSSSVSQYLMGLIGNHLLYRIMRSQNRSRQRPRS